MPADSLIRDHQIWLGYLQPDGLVVSPAALVDSQAILERNTLPLQERFLQFVEEIEIDDETEALAIKDFVAFVRDFLEWPDEFVFGANGDRPIPESLIVSLPGFGLTLSPTLAFKDRQPKDPENPWLLLVENLPLGTDLDAYQAEDERGWKASHSRRFERLLRETKVPIGLLSNGTHIRLTYAPHGENSGSITFPVAAMSEVQGRTILAALHMLLDRYRLLAAPTDARLPALLARSREYQSRVSAALAKQVLDSLYELQRGFHAANERTAGELLRSVLAARPDDVYAGLLSVLMRLVFLLFAEDRGLMPTSELYVRNYSIHGLFERLRSDNEHYPDTMDQRYGAWAQLLAVFRSVYRGSRHPQLHMPARHGHLFDPSRFPFLDGRSTAEARVPLVSDGTIFRILEKLLILGGERLSYRTLDVEEIGSVYQTVMGFRLEIASGPSIAILGKRKHKSEVAAPTVINLDELNATVGKERVKWLKERTNQDVIGEAEKALKKATTIDELLAALERKLARNATPAIVAKGAMVLQPTDERRRSGSHYTPRSFTEPIVHKTLAPVLERLGEQPTPEQILDLKVCDLAVGSGAFLVEACRQLGDALVKAWQHHGERPPLPADETEELLARRLVAQRCLYAVDRNPMAADLAKLSLWLATLAKDHPFTFLDHSIRVGDALVGLTRQQIADFHWLPEKERAFGQDEIEGRIRAASQYRKRILEGGDFVTPQKKHEQLELADEALKEVRFVGNMVIAAFLSGPTDRARRARRDDLLERYSEAKRNSDFTVGIEEVRNLSAGQFPVRPFHWELEFPEVFDRPNPGFDAIIGNPPFLGGTRISAVAGMEYFQWLTTMFRPCEHLCDLVAYFFRRSFNLLRNGGTFGLIATNTISQGDTREGGLRTILSEGGRIYYANRRYRWPGPVAVVVSVVHIAKGMSPFPATLDGKSVDRISAYLFGGVTDDSPARLIGNPYFSLGSKIYGQGFLFADNDPECTPIAERQRILIHNPSLESRILPYIGGEEILTHPLQQYHRYAIYLSDVESETDLEKWPELSEIVRTKVKPERDNLGTNPNNVPLRRKWWAYQAHRPELYRRLLSMKRVMATSQVSAQFAFTLLPTGWIYSQKAILFCIESFAGFAIVQSRVHELWARFFSSTSIELLSYTPSDCFETFPFPKNFDGSQVLESFGRDYFEFRTSVMVHHNEGLTKTYNRFHDPDESSVDILRLRELHAAIDRAVLEAYGWHDIAEKAYCEFLLDYEDEEDSENESPARRRKKPWRYRWPDDIRDEVLARLLDLNAKRAEAEKLAGLANADDRKARKPTRKRKVAEAQRKLI
jgi:methylase of polypeptide subunit release factors